MRPYIILLTQRRRLTRTGLGPPGAAGTEVSFSGASVTRVSVVKIIRVTLAAFSSAVRVTLAGVDNAGQRLEVGCHSQLWTHVC
jgi:hypothetical protein